MIVGQHENDAAAFPALRRRHFQKQGSVQEQLTGQRRADIARRRAFQEMGQSLIGQITIRGGDPPLSPLEVLSYPDVVTSEEPHPLRAGAATSHHPCITGVLRFSSRLSFSSEKLRNR